MSPRSSASNPATLVDSLNVEDLMDRFQQAKGTRLRSAAAYPTRMRVATQLHAAWLDNDPDWRQIYRTRPPASGPGGLQPPGPGPTNPNTQTVEFPVTADVVGHVHGGGVRKVRV